MSRRFERAPEPPSLFPDLEVPEPAEPMSKDRRRTARQRHLLAQGIHPATRRPLLGGGETCSGCVAFLRVAHHDKAYLKCVAAGLSHGAGTDVRASWPACDRFAPVGEWGGSSGAPPAGARSRGLASPSVSTATNQP